MSSDPDQCCFILLVRKYGRKKEQHVTRSSVKDSIEVLPGTLLLLVDGSYVRGKLLFETFDFDKTIEVDCERSEEVKGIQSYVVDLLRPIPTCQERLEVFKDPEWINEGLKLKIGDRVFVKLKGASEELRGRLQYKGRDFPESKGVVFGVELDVSEHFLFFSLN